ncbi:MerR family transcriptional regulator [Bosea sp. BK604]|uniref:MerR family transcriptional regulator n=1 Tax=Bosea sp. BK604 TaxID=2512180 RepID=UPI0010D57174|nr:MerR family transcriptional regulator [Bosea sp. BK604]TCR60673.1 MerR-like DNA binding protein [Bosea sp. BK604]
MNLEFHTGDTEAELDSKSPDAFRTISEVAEDLDIPQHVLRFWETRFNQIKPLKRGGGRRYYRPDDVALLKGIRRLLYGEGYTIKGLQRILKEQGPRHVQAIGRGAPVGAPPAAGGPQPGPPRSMPVDIEPAGEAPPSWQPDAADMAQQARQAAQDRDDLAVLAAALAELTECQRVLRGVLQPEAVGDGA